MNNSIKSGLALRFGPKQNVSVTSSLRTGKTTAPSQKASKASNSLGGSGARRLGGWANAPGSKKPDKFLFLAFTFFSISFVSHCLSILGLSFDSSATVHELGATERTTRNGIEAMTYAPAATVPAPIAPSRSCLETEPTRAPDARKGVEGRAHPPALRIAHVPCPPWRENLSQDQN
jgi:hypothetical protein